jgi:multiple antibiotic resistance protein
MPNDLFNFFLAAFTTLFSIVNPLGMMPVFLALTTSYTPESRNYTARKASVYMMGILAFFLFGGTFLMDFFSISLESLRIAGGLIVLRSGVELLSPKPKPRLSKKSAIEAMEKTDISLTPLAMPLLSGPGSIAATVSLGTQTQGHYSYNFLTLFAIIIIGLITYIILRVSPRLLPFLGNAGLEVTTRIMGFISMTVGVQFILNGITPILAKVNGIPLIH